MDQSSNPLATNSAPAVLGSAVPRLWTKPLRELDRSTTDGFDVIDFARDVLGRPLDRWQEWVVIHALELLEDGRPRFRQVLVLVARQNGKTELLVILALFWLHIDYVGLVLGTSTNLDYARESWEKAVMLAEDTDEIAAEIPKGGIRRANGEQTLSLVNPHNHRIKSRYKIAASNRKGGRSLTIARLIMDELREHHDWSAWNAAMPAMNAVRMAQAWLISNQGDDKSVVLDSARNSAIAFIETGVGDSRLAIFEYSAPDGSRPTDVEALAMANPNLGHRIDLDALLGDAVRAEEAGGEELAGFKTEIMCMRVQMLDPAIDAEAWTACLELGDLEEYRSSVACCIDVSMDGQHASLVAAALLRDGRVRVEPLASWTSVEAMRVELPEWVRRVKPRKLGWFPSGPAAAFAADMAERGAAGTLEAWPPFGVEVEELKAAVTAVCMGFAEQVAAHKIAHSDDQMLNAHVAAAEKLRQGDAWRFTRHKAGLHVDGTYAAAGATHLARTLPPPPPELFIRAGRAR